MKIDRLIASGLLAALSLAGVQSASAADAKNYPGSMCVQWSSGGTVKYSYSRLGNSNTSTTLKVDCPAVKDATSIAGGWLRGLDRSAAADIECILTSAYVNTTDDLVYSWTSTRSTAGSAAAHQQINFPALSGNDAGFYYLSCSIPPSVNGNVSYVATYQVNEN